MRSKNTIIENLRAVEKARNRQRREARRRMRTQSRMEGEELSADGRPRSRSMGASRSGRMGDSSHSIGHPGAAPANTILPTVVLKDGTVIRRRRVYRKQRGHRHSYTSVSQSSLNSPPGRGGKARMVKAMGPGGRYLVAGDEELPGYHPVYREEGVADGDEAFASDDSESSESRYVRPTPYSQYVRVPGRRSKSAVRAPSHRDIEIPSESDDDDYDDVHELDAHFDAATELNTHRKAGKKRLACVHFHRTPHHPMLTRRLRRLLALVSSTTGRTKHPKRSPVSTIRSDTSSDEHAIEFPVELGQTPFGLQLYSGLSTPVVRSLIPGSAAERSGKIQTGDQVVEVNGVSLANFDLDTAIKQLRIAAQIVETTQQLGQVRPAVLTFRRMPMAVVSPFSPTTPPTEGVRTPNFGTAAAAAPEDTQGTEDAPVMSPEAVAALRNPSAHSLTASNEHVQAAAASPKGLESQAQPEETRGVETPGDALQTPPRQPSPASRSHGDEPSHRGSSPPKTPSSVSEIASEDGREEVSSGCCMPKRRKKGKQAKRSKEAENRRLQGMKERREKKARESQGNRSSSRKSPSRRSRSPKREPRRSGKSSKKQTDRAAEPDFVVVDGTNPAETDAAAAAAHRRGGSPRTSSAFT